MIRLDRNYVWECDYGVRKPLIPVLIELLNEQDASSLQMVSLFVNNNPYHLEFYLVVSFDNPLESHINNMRDRMSGLGLRHRPDITFEELFNELSNRRFNISTISNGDQVEFKFTSGFFLYPEIEYLRSQGYMIKPLGKKLPVFLSHSSRDKPDIEDLIPYFEWCWITRVV